PFGDRGGGDRHLGRTQDLDDVEQPVGAPHWATPCAARRHLPRPPRRQQLPIEGEPRRTIAAAVPAAYLPGMSEAKPQDETPPETPNPPAPQLPKEIGGPPGPEPTRYGDWEYKGRC